MSQPIGRPAPEDRAACVNENYAVGSDAAGPGQGISARALKSRDRPDDPPLTPREVAELLVLPALAAFGGA